MSLGRLPQARVVLADMTKYISLPCYPEAGSSCADDVMFLSQPNGSPSPDTNPSRPRCRSLPPTVVPRQSSEDPIEYKRWSIFRCEPIDWTPFVDFFDLPPNCRNPDKFYKGRFKREHYENPVDWSPSEDCPHFSVSNWLLKQRLHRMTRRVSLNKGRSHSASNQNGVVGPATEAKAALGAAVAPLLRKKRQQSGVEGNPMPGEEPLKKINKLMKKDHLGARLRRRTPSESSKPETPDRSILNKLKTIWTTKETYTTIVGETESAMRWAGSSAADSESVSKQVPTSSKAALEVPKWRTHCYSPIYSMEGTEDLSDNVYDRKHEKLAADEKRRKRWDCQRIRELRVVERQREKEAQKEAARKNAREESSGTVETNSFWPEPPELGERLTLCVSDEVPIGFCGINLLPPSKEEQEFCLPWKNGGCEQPMKPRRRGKR